MRAFRSPQLAFSVPAQVMPLDQRRAIFQRAVAVAAVKGWTVIVQHDTSAELLRAKRFNWPLAIIAGVPTFGILFVIAYVEYALASPRSATIAVDEQGLVTSAVKRQWLVS